MPTYIKHKYNILYVIVCILVHSQISQGTFTHTFEHDRQFRHANQPTALVFGLCEETGELEKTPEP